MASRPDWIASPVPGTAAGAYTPVGRPTSPSYRSASGSDNGSDFHGDDDDDDSASLPRLSTDMDFAFDTDLRSPKRFSTRAWIATNRGSILYGFGCFALLLVLIAVSTYQRPGVDMPVIPKAKLAVSPKSGLDGIDPARPIRDASDVVAQLWRANDMAAGSDPAAAVSLPWDRRTRQHAADAGKERVLIMSADSRPLQRLADVKDDPHELVYMTTSAMYHTWYALRHGYDYRRVQIAAPPGWHGTWAKVKAIYDALHRYDIVVFLDGDAFVAQPDKSIAWMMKRWGFHERASLLLPMDPPDQPEANKNATNTGFWIARSTPVAKTALRKLMTCPDDQPDCEQWKTTLYNEQTVFNRYIRPTLREGEDFIIAPCMEANGWWGWKDGYCQGKVITHPWFNKQDGARRMTEIMMRDHVRMYERFLFDGYHHGWCAPWEKGTNELCSYAGDPL
ncbi:hypothetical protein H9P43_000815 [Blastocladiella emersonii ATCC 22665]|nr:hypothetical protein H9P43_000815 [Blastocladiella emersonii ATCC 22665]